jgi:hypothetical protein
MLQGKCPFCNEGELIWQSDFSFEDYSIDGDGIVQATGCTNCDVFIESHIPIPIKNQQNDL